MSTGAVYVETRIACGLDELWARTQEPALHRRWDVRFSRIEYLPRPAEGEPQRFRYERSLLPGFVVSGWGETRGERSSGAGKSASALAFGSDQGRSLIRDGSGYWLYEPVDDGVRFVTRYDYEPRWGALGRLVDRLVFRRLIGWATAWSFDRLRLWLERDIPPERSARAAVVCAAARCASAFVLVRLAAGARGSAPRTLLLLTLSATGLGCCRGSPSARRCLRRPPS